MLLSAKINDKHFGAHILYDNLHITLNKNEKVGLIGRNGTGKSTLFNILCGQDTDFDGDLQLARGSIVVSTRQEHTGLENQSCLEYILDELPNYKRLKHIIDTYPTIMTNSKTKINIYSEAVDHFSSLGYYRVEGSVLQQLNNYQISEDMARAPIGQLSGGQKRFMELVKIAHSKADLTLIDEPTNHMDYLAKDSFIRWLKELRGQTALIITHDRDVLNEVSRIIEIKDKTSDEFKGNYSAYLKQNSSTTVRAIRDYEVAQATLNNLKKQIEYARVKAPGYRGKSANNPWVVMRKRLQKEYDHLDTIISRPSFWIDRESIETLEKRTAQSYQKYKAKNIRLGKIDSKIPSGTLPIVEIHDLSLGYKKPLFNNLSFELKEGGRLRIHGRNGAGKTTLVNSILATNNQIETNAKCFNGKIEVRPKLNIGIYEQEIATDYLELPLKLAIERLHFDKGLSISTQRIMQLMSDYLFDPNIDDKTLLTRLSGGQKARFQLISMLSNNPDLLILDEPTNHLDLPSIEELETALTAYKGAVIFVSHDGYFVDKFEHQTIILNEV